MTELILIGSLAALYVLGAYQGKAIKDMVEAEVLREDLELSPIGAFYLVWLWPIATVDAMLNSGKEVELG